MKLSAKTFLLLLTIALMGFSSAIYMQQNFVRPTLIELEAKADRKDVERVLIGFDMVRHTLNLLAYDYSIWDDSYDFFNKQNQEFLDNNFGVTTFLSNDINVVVLADKDGKILWYRHADLDEEVIFPAGFFDPSEFLPYMANANAALPGAPISISGFIDTSLGPTIFASYSVLKSDESGQSPGSLLLARYIDENTIEEVQDMVKMRFSTPPITEQDSVTLQKLDLKKQYRDSNGHIGWFLKDIDGNPIVKLSIQLDKRSFNDRAISKPIITAFALVLVSLIIIILLLNRKLVRPILTINKHLMLIRSSGDFSLRLNSPELDEVGDLSNELDLLTQYIEHQHEVVEQQSKELHRLSYEDGLTKLANRRRFDQLLADYWKLCRRDKRPMAMLLCDIDFFKFYNDNYGHQAGDEALIRVASAFGKSVCRNSDLAARYGGEEFALVLPYTDQDGAIVVVERLQKKIKELAIQHEYSKASKIISLSIGVSVMSPAPNNEPEQLISNADRALYQAKESGRDKYCCFEITES